MTERTCKACGGPLVTRLSTKYPEGRPLPACAINCENCGPGNWLDPRPPGTATMRARVLACLSNGPRRARALAAELGENQRTVENALTTLRRAGQVRSEKRVWYCVEGGVRP